jgi:hypothetical protein
LPWEEGFPLDTLLKALRQIIVAAKDLRTGETGQHESVSLLTRLNFRRDGKRGSLGRFVFAG